MASAMALSPVSVFTGIGIVTAMAVDPLGLVAKFGLWKILGVVFALLNLKNIPSFWHVRVLSAFITHLWIKPPSPKTLNASTIFQPSIVKMRNSLMDCDFNIHKSNSTYFTDLDIARSHHVPLLCGRGISKVRKQLVKGNDKFGIMLGGVQCSFRKEIKPFQGFEIWTRLLAWDKKWLYIVSYIVEKGAVQPQGYTFQPWRKLKAAKEKRTNAVLEGTGQTADGKKTDSVTAQPKIYATSIAKYVFKHNRLTIPPAQILEAGGLLPPRPPNVSTPSESSTPSDIPDTTSNEPMVAAMVESLSSASADATFDASLKPLNGYGDTRNWQRIEDERTRGMKIAGMFNGLDTLSEEFNGEDDMALGIYLDPV